MKTLPDRATTEAGSGRTAIVGVILGCLAAMTTTTGCDISEPELPTFSTSLSLPIGEERVDILDIIEDEEYLEVLDDGGLLFSTTGEADTVSLDFDFALDINGEDVSTEIGVFAVEVADPADFDFTLADIYPTAVALDGATVPVPAFDFSLDSDPTTLDGFTSANISSGSIEVTITNGLPVDVSGPAPPERVSVTIIDATTDLDVVTVVFDSAVPAGATRSASAPLDGIIFPSSLKVQLNGGSAGSGPQPVTIDAGAQLGVSASLVDLRVDAATAEISAQEFTAGFTSPLPDGYALGRAEIATGSLPLSLANSLAIPCNVSIAWREVFDAAGQPVSIDIDLAGGQSADRTINLAGCTIEAGAGELLTDLHIDIDVTSPGSTGVVTVSATDALSAVISPASLSLGEVTGTFPIQTFDFDEVSAEVNLPDELDGVRLTQASLVLTVANELGIGADVSFELVGTNEQGQTNDLQLVSSIEGAVDRAGSRETVLVFDGSNSDIIDFINGLPTEIVMTGVVTAGGPGEVGTVRPGDRAILDWEITAPLEVIVDGSIIDGSPDDLDFDEDTRDLINDHALGARVLAEVTNHLPFDVEIRIYASTDTLTIKTAPMLMVGPLSVDAGIIDPVTHTVSAATVSRPVIELSQADARVFATPGLYSQIEVTLPDSDGQIARLLSTDWLTVGGAVTLEIDVHDD